MDDINKKASQDISKDALRFGAPPGKVYDVSTLKRTSPYGGRHGNRENADYTSLLGLFLVRPRIR